MLISMLIVSVALYSLALVLFPDSPYWNYDDGALITALLFAIFGINFRQHQPASANFTAHLRGVLVFLVTGGLFHVFNFISLGNILMYGSIFYNPLMIWLLFFFNQFLLLLGLILALRLGYGIRIRVGSLFEGKLFVVYLAGGIILSIIDTVAYTSNRYLVASEVLLPVTGLTAFLIIYISTVSIALVIAYKIFNKAYQRQGSGMSAAQLPGAPRKTDGQAGQAGQAGADTGSPRIAETTEDNLEDEPPAQLPREAKPRLSAKTAVLIGISVLAAFILSESTSLLVNISLGAIAASAYLLPQILRLTLLFFAPVLVLIKCQAYDGQESRWPRLLGIALLEAAAVLVLAYLLPSIVALTPGLELIASLFSNIIELLSMPICLAFNLRIMKGLRSSGKGILQTKAATVAIIVSIIAAILISALGFLDSLVFQSTLEKGGLSLIALFSYSSPLALAMDTLWLTSMIASSLLICSRAASLAYRQ